MWAVIDSPDGKGSGGDGILTGEDLHRANTTNNQSVLKSLKTILGNAANVSTPAAQMAINVLNFGNAIVAEGFQDWSFLLGDSQTRGQLAEKIGTKLDQAITSNNSEDFFTKHKGAGIWGVVLAIFGGIFAGGWGAILGLLVGGIGGSWADGAFDKVGGGSSGNSLSNPTAGSAHSVTVDGVHVNGQVLANGKFQVSSVSVPDVESGKTRNILVKDMQLAVNGKDVAPTKEQMDQLKETSQKATDTVNAEKVTQYRDNPPLTMISNQKGADGIDNYRFTLGVVRGDTTQDITLTAWKNTNGDLEVTSASGVKDFRPFTIPIGFLKASIPEKCGATEKGSSLAKTLTTNLEKQLPAVVVATSSGVGNTVDPPYIPQRLPRKMDNTPTYTDDRILAEDGEYTISFDNGTMLVKGTVIGNRFVPNNVAMTKFSDNQFPTTTSAI